MENLIKFITSARGLAIYLVIIVILLLAFIFIIWPEENNPVQTKFGSDSTYVRAKPDSSIKIQGELQPVISKVHTDSVELKLKLILSDSTVFNTTIPILPKQNPYGGKTLLWLILLIGAVGSSLHGLNSLSNYIGNQDFKTSWAFWYLLRPFVGAILSFIFYLTIRAGFFKQFGTKEEFYVVMALSALIGLFSKQALNKLSDLFDFIFTSNKDKDLKNKIGSNPIPKIEAIAPDRITIGSPDQLITINGSDFINESVVRINQNEIKPSFISSKQLEFILTKNYTQNACTIQISVFNPKPEGGLSNVVNLNIA